MAAAQHKSVQQLAVEQLCSLVQLSSGERIGSPAYSCGDAGHASLEPIGRRRPRCRHCGGPASRAIAWSLSGLIRLRTFFWTRNAISALMREDARMASWLSSVGPEDLIVTCPIARGEILFRSGKLAQGRRRTQLEEKAHKLFSALPCEPIPPAAGEHYATVKLAQQRRGLSWMRTICGSLLTALAIGATLVSSDSDLQRDRCAPACHPLIRLPFMRRPRSLKAATQCEPRA